MDRGAIERELESWGKFYYLINELQGGGWSGKKHYFVTSKGAHISQWISPAAFEHVKEMYERKEIPLVLRQRVPDEVACLDACTRILKRVAGLTGIVVRLNNFKPDLCYGSSPPSAVLHVDRRGEKFFITRFSRGQYTEDNFEQGDKCFFLTLKDLFQFGMPVETFKNTLSERLISDHILHFHLDRGPSGCEVEIEGKLNDAAERLFPSQDSWRFNGKTDVDLRTINPLEIAELHAQRVDAMKIALSRIQGTLQKWSLACPAAHPSMFHAKRWDTVLLRGPFGTPVIGKFPTLLERSFEVLDGDGDHIDLSFTVSISIHNPLDAAVPHIRYAVHHHGDSPETLSGRILLSPLGNEDLPDLDRSSTDGSGLYTIPSNRIFCFPISDGLCLQRAVDISEAVRGQSYPTSQF